MKPRFYALSMLLLLALTVVGCSGNSEEGQAKTDMAEMSHAAEETAMTASVGQPAPDFTLTSAEGATHSLADFKGKYVVLEWINFDCPFVRKHYDSNNMQDMQKAVRDSDGIWLAICSSAEGKQGYFAGQTLTDRLAKEGIQANAYLIDSDGTVGRMYGAQTTPHMYVINPDGDLIYAGAIDDKPSVKTEDIPGSTNYVKAALDAAWAGEEVTTKSTKAYGCSVKY